MRVAIDFGTARAKKLANPNLKKGPPVMPRGDKTSYTEKQKRQAAHIEESYEQRGVPADDAEKRAWATVNKESGGGKKSGSGRSRPAVKKGKKS